MVQWIKHLLHKCGDLSLNLKIHIKPDVVSCVYNSNTMVRWQVKTGDTVEVCKPPVLMYSGVISITNKVEGDYRHLSLFSGLCRCITTYMHLHSYMQTCTYIIHTRKSIFCSQDITCIILKLKKVKEKEGKWWYFIYFYTIAKLALEGCGGARIWTQELFFIPLVLRRESRLSIW